MKEAQPIAEAGSLNIEASQATRRSAADGGEASRQADAPLADPVENSAKPNGHAEPEAALAPEEADRFAMAFRPSWEPVAPSSTEAASNARFRSFTPSLAPLAPPAAQDASGLLQDDLLRLRAAHVRMRSLALAAVSVLSFGALMYWGISSTTDGAEHSAARGLQPAPRAAEGAVEDVTPSASAPIPEPTRLTARLADPNVPTTAVEPPAADGEQTPEAQATAGDTPAVEPSPNAAPADAKPLAASPDAKPQATITDVKPATAAADAKAATADAKPLAMAAETRPTQAAEPLAAAAETKPARAAEPVKPLAAAAETKPARAAGPVKPLAAAAETKPVQVAGAPQTAKPAAVPTQPAVPAPTKPAAAATKPAAVSGGEIAAAPAQRPAAAQLQPAQPAASPTPPAAAVKTAPAAEATAQPPLLVVRAVPDNAQLFLDGQRMPNPFDTRLPLGSKHKIDAQQDGYETSSQSIRLEADAKLSITLKRVTPAPEPHLKVHPLPESANGAGFVTSNPY